MKMSGSEGSAAYNNAPMNGQLLNMSNLGCKTYLLNACTEKYLIIGLCNPGNHKQFSILGDQKLINLDSHCEVPDICPLLCGS